MSVEVKCEVTVYEQDGTETTRAPDLVVRSHWSRENMVVVEFGGSRVTVAADDLQAAIGKAQRHD